MKRDQIKEAQRLLEEKGYKIISPEEVSHDGWLPIPELGVEVEKEVHDKDKSWNDLKLSERENDLLTAENCLFLMNSKYAKQLKMDGSSTQDDFFIKQYSNLSKCIGYVARFWFYAYSGNSCLDSHLGASYSYSGLGVRFCRKISGGKKK